jgi:RNA polymerase sigma-70 factor (ECF subfamily)
MNDTFSERGFGDESALILELKQGNPEAVNQIVERYSKPLFAFIMRMVDDQATAEDIFQDTWVRVVRNIGSFRGDSKFSTWLFQIALNLCRNLMRSRARRSFVGIEEVSDLSEDPEVDGMKILQAQKVRMLVASLPSKMREVIVLRYYHEKTDVEIAEVTGLPPGTVKSRLHRATELLRSKIEGMELTVPSAEVE